MEGHPQAPALPPDEAIRRLRAVARRLDDLTVIVAKDGSWEVPLPTAALHRYGLPAGSVDLTDLYARVHPDDVPALRGRIDKMIEHDGTAAVQRIRLRQVDGGWRTLEISMQDLLDDPDVHGVMLHLHDITDLATSQHEHAEESARLLTLLDSLDAGVLLEDGHRRIIAINRPLIEMFGIDRPPGELIGVETVKALTGYADLFRDPDAFLDSVERAIADGQRRLAEEFALKDGRVLHRDYAPVRSGDEFVGHLWAFWNVTSMKATERRVKAQNRTLAELFEAKTQFIASVSHELRTPLSSITGFTELLLSPAGTAASALPPEQRGYLEVIDRNAKRLLSLVNDLLFAAQIEARRLPLDTAELDFADLARDAVRDRTVEATQRGIRVHADVPDTLMIRGDGSRLIQVLDNLLSNAIKFSRSGGAVGVTIRARDREDWQMIVTDNGIGVPADDLPRLFRSFYRAANVRDTTPGTGLGLVICRAIVDRHGGNIDVDSIEGSGTTVTVTLPVQPPKEEGVAPA